MITTVIADGKKEYDFIELLKAERKIQTRMLFRLCLKSLKMLRQTATRRYMTTPLNLTAKHLKRQRFLLMKSTP